MVDLQRPIADKGMLFASGFKITAKIAIQMLCPTPIAAENSLRGIRARILFAHI
jgi:hypothetical protein